MTEKSNMRTPLKYYTITHSTHVSEVGETSVTALDVWTMDKRFLIKDNIFSLLIFVVMDMFPCNGTGIGLDCLVGTTEIML